jgi:hypothetical protein
MVKSDGHHRDGGAETAGMKFTHAAECLSRFSFMMVLPAVCPVQAEFAAALARRR